MRETDDDLLERTLLRRIAAGDEDALHDLYARLRPRLWRYLWRQLDGDRPLIEDTLQETFLALWRAAASFRGEARVATWAFQIARRLSWRARNAVTRQPETFSGNGDEERWDDTWPWRQDSFEDAALDRVAFGEALRRLTPKHRETLELVFHAGFTLDETAAILSIPTGTVKSRISFARQALMRALRHGNGGPEYSAAPSQTQPARNAHQEAHRDD